MIDHSVEKVACYDLFVVRVRVDGSLACSNPCVECARWIEYAKTLGIHFRIYHINREGEIIPHDGSYKRYKPKVTFW